MNQCLIASPEIETGSTESLSDGFYARLIKFYQEYPDLKAYLSPIWQGVLKGLCSLTESLQQGNVTELKEILNSLYKTHLVTGMDHPVGTIAGYFAQELRGLAYCCGALPVFNPHQDDNKTFEFEEVLDRVITQLPFHLHWPGKSGAVPGVRRLNNFVPIKLLEAATMVVSVERLIDSPKVIMEIGAGTGFTTFLLAQAYPDSQLFTVDLPVVSVMHGFLLAAACGEDAVSFRGERLSKFNLLGPDAAWIGAEPIDLCVNRNSLPEIPQKVALWYLSNALTCLSPRRGIFYSLNHESTCGGQVSVADLVRELGEDLRCVGRYPAWPMAGELQGYVQEIYQKQ